METQFEDIKPNFQMEFNIHLQKKKIRKGRMIPVYKLLSMEINLNPDTVTVIQYIFSVKKEKKRKINTPPNRVGGEGTGNCYGKCLGAMG